MERIRELADRTNFLEQNYFESSKIGQISGNRVMEEEFLKLGCSAKARGKLGKQMNDLWEQSNPSKNLENLKRTPLQTFVRARERTSLGGCIQMIRNNFQQEASVATVKCLPSVMGEQECWQEFQRGTRE